MNINSTYKILDELGLKISDYKIFGEFVRNNNNSYEEAIDIIRKAKSVKDKKINYPVIIQIEDEMPLRKGWIIPCVLLTLGTVGLGFGTEYLAPYVRDAAHTLMNPHIYVEAILEGKIP